jgi:Flp pilus assembly pilin Flp
MRKLVAILRDQRGVETLEWIIVGGLITVVAIAVYETNMKTGLTGAVTSIIDAITGKMPK